MSREAIKDWIDRYEKFAEKNELLEDEYITLWLVKQLYHLTENSQVDIVPFKGEKRNTGEFHDDRDWAAPVPVMPERMPVMQVIDEANNVPVLDYEDIMLGARNDLAAPRWGWNAAGDRLDRIGDQEPNNEEVEDNGA